MKQYVVDAFTDEVFSGNPAAVCITKEWLSDDLMMNITRENNLSETAFAVKERDRYKLRWFTPGTLRAALTAVIAMISSEILFNACFSDIVSPH